MKLGVVLVAAGSSQRAGCDKLYVKMGGRTAIERAAAAFLQYENTKKMVIVSREDRLEENKALLGREAGGVEIVFAVGGKTRSESVQNGLRALGNDVELVAVHDAARPFVSGRIIRETAAAAEKYGAAAPVLPLKDTILQREGDFAVGQLVRSQHAAVQTPQIFKLPLLREAYARAKGTFTDDTQVFMAAGGRVFLTEGEERNDKLTTPADMERKDVMPLRIGHGYDAHRFRQGRKMILCGVQLDTDYGMDGVSDADVPVHALMDALLGACGSRDIGYHFPPKDEAYRGISSMLLLDKTLRIVEEAGYSPVSADITIVAEQPKLSAYIPRMTEKLSAAVGCPVNVKATTEEGMGFTGAREGLAAHAVVLLEGRTV